MTNISELKKQVADSLQGSTLLTDYEVVEEFSTLRRSALHKPVITVGIDSIKMLPAGLGGYFGKSTEDGEYEGAWADITLRFDCYSNASLPNQDNQQVFERLAQELLHLGIGITRISSSPIVTSKGAFNVSLAATAQLQTLVASSKPVTLVRDFIVKRSDSL